MSITTRVTGFNTKLKGKPVYVNVPGYVGYALVKSSTIGHLCLVTRTGEEITVSIGEVVNKPHAVIEVVSDAADTTIKEKSKCFGYDPAKDALRYMIEKN